MHGILALNWRSLLRLLDLTICVLFKSESGAKDQLIESILGLDEEMQLELQTMIERSFNLAGGNEEQEAYLS